MQLFSNSGQIIKVGKLLGRGAKGDVYSVEGHAKLAAKVYREPLSPRMAERLMTMVRLDNQRLLKVSAWPLQTLSDSPNGRIQGFLMTSFAGFKPIHQLTGVKSRMAHYATAGWPFLIHTAANAARTFSVIHEHNHVIGDVSSTNVLVSNNALVALIDCDNFQVVTATDRFFCEGGTTGFIPSELIGADFSRIIRTQNHDSFGLAVLIFQLLMMGRHPFSGTFRDGGEKDLDFFVRERRFAYGASAEARKMAPPPGTLPLEALGPQIAGMFERAFLSENRPSPPEWIEALEKLARSLRKCDFHNGHYYLKTLPACPWCQLERVSGVRLFNFVVSDRDQVKITFNLREAWSKIEHVERPGAPPALAETAGIPIQPSVEAFAAGAKRRRNWLQSILLSGLLTLPLAAALFWSVPTMVVIIGYLFVMMAGIFISNGGNFTTKVQKSLADSPDPVIRQFYERKQEAERIVAHYQQRWNEEAGEMRFHQKLEELRAKKSEHVSLPALQQRKLHDLEKMSRERQLTRFLDAYRIADGRIQDIGPDKLINLQAYGLETAADVSRESLQRVPGFSGALSYRLLSWRQSLEQRFVFNPAQAVTPNDRYTVEQEIHSIRLKLEQELANGPSYLRVLAQEILAARGALQGKLEEARLVLRQTEADLREAAQTNSPVGVISTMAGLTALVLLIRLLLG
jgi:DNA-binding helix-hairpin-helix protein with protein kinase domain